MIAADDAPSGSVTRARRAEHAGQGFEPEIGICRRGIEACDELEYVAHITTGTWNFSVDGRTRDLEPENFDRAAKTLYLIVQRMQEATDVLHSGSLIRVLVHGDRGALFHDVKVTGQSYFAATRQGSREVVDRVDRALEQVVDEAAKECGAPTQNLGSYRTRATRDQWVRSGDGGVPPAEHASRPVPASASLPIPEPARTRCLQALDLADVHFVGVYRDEKLLWRADLFNNPGLEQLFTGVSPEIRRLGYDQVIRQAAMDDRRVSQLLDAVHSDRLTRLVLDVARGAIYIMPFDDGEHVLLGVTLVQSQVQRADEKMTKLHSDLASWFAGSERARNVPA